MEKLTEMGIENENLKEKMEAETSIRGQQKAEFDGLFKQVFKLYYNNNEIAILIDQGRFTRFKICFYGMGKLN